MKKIINLLKNKETWRHPLVISLCSGLIVGIVGTFLTYQFNKQNLERQMQLELYKDLIHQQSIFVDHLSKDIYSRVYKLSTYVANLKSGNNKKAEEFWLRCKDESVSWSEELRFYLTNLDRYFPKEEFEIGSYIKAKDLFKKHLNSSFREILEKDIQPSFYSINNALSELNMRNAFDTELGRKELNRLDKEVDNLYKRVYEFTEGLSRASSYYKISAKTRLLKKNF